MKPHVAAPKQNSSQPPTRRSRSVTRPAALRSSLVALTGALLLLGTVAPATAAPHGGFSAGAHARFGGGFARGGFARGGFARGGFARGYPGRGYGWRGYGWRGYGWGPYWGWGLGLGLGALYLSTLPWDYATYWWDGVPYYYAGNNYYIWDGADGQYEAVQPPPQVSQQVAHAPPMKLYAYPKNGQSPQQQAADTAECERWARQQIEGSANAAQPESAPPASSVGGSPSGAPSASATAHDQTAVGALAQATASDAGSVAPGIGQGSMFSRAEAACLTGKGYSVD